MARPVVKTPVSIRRLLIDESGPTAVEYAIMLALIIGVCIICIGPLGQATKDLIEIGAAMMQQISGP